VNVRSAQTQAAASQRWDVIDVARGVAICAMVVYHFGWDLSFLKLIETNVVQLPAWRWFARSIAGSFLILAGFGLALAHFRGFRSRPFWLRLMKVGGAALAVSAVTFFAFPDSYIFFGILHCIAVSSILALPFLRLHAVLTLGFAAFCLAAPLIFTNPAFDEPWLDWLGLGSVDPVTNDYVPIFPWFGLVLIGVAAGKALLAREAVHLAREAAPGTETLGLARWRVRDALSRFLIWAGRKSLPIYLLHQLALLAILYGVLQVTGPNPMAEARPFIAECEASCLQQNGQPALCRATCSCIARNLRQTDLWQKILANDLDAEDQTRVSRAAQQCLRGVP
jgi:uncharacterized membrane protein